MSSATIQSSRKLNGVAVAELEQLIANSADPKQAAVGFSVSTRWQGGALSETRVDGYHFGGQWIERDFSIQADEPSELCGQNTQPNPQELLMAAFNSCMVVGYVAGATLNGIKLDRLEIQTEGQLDLRGFLGLDATVKPGYDAIHYTVTIAGNGTPAQFQQIHETVMKSSPNRWNIANPIKLIAELVVE